MLSFIFIVCSFKNFAKDQENDGCIVLQEINNLNNIF